MFSVSRSVQFLVAKFSFQSWFFSFCFCWLHSFHVRYKNLSLNHFLNRFCFKVCLCLLQLLLQLRSTSLPPSLSLSLSLSGFVSVAGSQHSRNLSLNLPRANYATLLVCRSFFLRKRQSWNSTRELCAPQTHMPCYLHCSLTLSLPLSLAVYLIDFAVYLRCFMSLLIFTWSTRGAVHRGRHWACFALPCHIVWSLKLSLAWGTLLAHNSNWIDATLLLLLPLGRRTNKHHNNNNDDSQWRNCRQKLDELQLLAAQLAKATTTTTPKKKDSKTTRHWQRW